MKHFAKGFLALVLCVVLCVGFLPASVIAAGSDPVIRVGSASGCMGSTVNVTISLENNPGLSSIKLLVSYDRELLELKSASLNSALVSYPGSQSSVNVGAYPAVFNWLMITDGNMDLDGEFAALTFEVLTAEAQETAITVSYNQEDVYNADFEDVHFAVENGTVTLGAHDLSYVAGTAATCTEAGEREHWHCGVCGKDFADEAAATELSDLVLPPLGHDYSYFTGVCTRCGEQEPGFPADDTPTFRIGDAVGYTGREVSTMLRIENNPGISSAMVMVSFDPELLEFESAALNEYLADNQYSRFSVREDNGMVVLNWIWIGDGNISASGDAIKLTFLVREGIEPGTTPLDLIYEPENVFNASSETVRFFCDGGELTLRARLLGDVNGDGKINNRDAQLLFRYVSGLEILIEFFLDAMDVNNDGKINNRDAQLLFRYVSGLSVVFG